MPSQYTPRTYSRHPRICRINPSALASATRPSRHARSAAAITVRGSSSLRFIAADNREW